VERRYCLLRLIKRDFIVPKFHKNSHIFDLTGTKVRNWGLDGLAFARELFKLVSDLGSKHMRSGTSVPGMSAALNSDALD